MFYRLSLPSYSVSFISHSNEGHPGNRGISYHCMTKGLADFGANIPYDGLTINSHSYFVSLF